LSFDSIGIKIDGKVPDQAVEAFIEIEAVPLVYAVARIRNPFIAATL
jgi:hypothetical protein